MENEIKKVLKDILVWQKIIGMSVFRSLEHKVLDSTKKKQVYELTDGENSISLISKKTGVSTGTISNWWNKWELHGIVSKENGRYKKIVSIKGLDAEGSDNG